MVVVLLLMALPIQLRPKVAAAGVGQFAGPQLVPHIKADTFGSHLGRRVEGLFKRLREIACGNSDFQRRHETNPAEFLTATRI